MRGTDAMLSYSLLLRVLRLLLTEIGTDLWMISDIVVLGKRVASKL